MNRRKIRYEEYAEQIIKKMGKGILLTAKADNRANSMVIGWGTIGINWGKPVFVAYVRTGRFTCSLLDKNPEFTVNIPLEEADPKTLSVCGSRSGRDIDKIKEVGLTLVDPEVISVPAIKEFPLTLECRVMYRQEQEIDLYEKDVLERYYPQDVPSESTGVTRDAHVMFFGEIVSAYIIE